jgi:hypothetical protein
LQFSLSQQTSSNKGEKMRVLKVLDAELVLVDLEVNLGISR